MKTLFFQSLIILNISLSFAQDTIITKTQNRIIGKVLTISVDEVSYKKQENLAGPLYTVKKSDLFEIIYDNGLRENFLSDTSLRTIDQTKEYIVKMINQFCFEEDNDERRYRASFEDDRLRLVVMNKKGTGKVNNGLLYDFAHVYDFQEISKRKNEIAFLNIWIPFYRTSATVVAEKRKLVLRVHGYREAQEISNALKYYNKLLIDKLPAVEKL
jgi:hypothetical protein